MNWAEAFFYSVAVVGAVIVVGFLTDSIQIVITREESDEDDS